MKVGDLVIWRDTKFSRHRVWRIEGIYLGSEGQESLIELRNLIEKPGVAPGQPDQGTATTFVPEPLIRYLPIYTPMVYA